MCLCVVVVDDDDDDDDDAFLFLSFFLLGKGHMDGGNNCGLWEADRSDR